MKQSVNQSAAHQAVFSGKPVEANGLKLWGLTMRQYEEWAKCKNVWLARQSTFPVFCITLSFLDALFALDMSAIENTGNPAGFLYSVMYCLGMALRMDEDCVRDGHIYLSADEEPRKFNAIMVRLPGENEPIAITSSSFKQIRETVAWMQGDELPDETLNDELLETEKVLADQNSPHLKYSLLDLEASVGLAYNARIRDVLDWPILEFETSRRAIDRAKRFDICGIGATNGCKWDGGNPYPSWCFDREKTGSNALISASQFGQAKVRNK